MKKLFDILDCDNCGTSLAIRRDVCKEWREKYGTVFDFPVECCKQPDPCWWDIGTSIGRVFLEG